MVCRIKLKLAGKILQLDISHVEPKLTAQAISLEKFCAN